MPRTSSLLALFGPSTLLALAACGPSLEHVDTLPVQSAPLDTASSDTAASDTASLDTALLEAMLAPRLSPLFAGDSGGGDSGADSVVSADDTRVATALGTGPDDDADGYATSLDCD